MSSFVFGTYLTAACMAVLVGVNLGIVSGIAAGMMVIGVAYMITGTIVNVAKASTNVLRELKK